MFGRCGNEIARRYPKHDVNQQSGLRISRSRLPRYGRLSFGRLKGLDTYWGLAAESAATVDPKDAVFTAFVLAIGAFQEWKAGKSSLALQNGDAVQCPTWILPAPCRMIHSLLSR